MKIIIAGTRTVTNPKALAAALDDAHITIPGLAITEVVCGKAPGADTLGEEWALAHGIPVRYFPANWDQFGKSAGPRRNSEMADYADAAVVLWDGSSRGTQDMINKMKSRGKPCHIHLVY